MPLVDIRRLLGALDAPSEPHPDVDKLVQEQLEKVRVRLQSMRALEKTAVAAQASCGRCRGMKALTAASSKELVAAAHGEACCLPFSRFTLPTMEDGIALSRYGFRRNRGLLFVLAVDSLWVVPAWLFVPAAASLALFAWLPDLARCCLRAGVYAAHGWLHIGASHCVAVGY